MKKTRILLLAMLLTFTLSGSAAPAAERVVYISGDFTYTLDQSGNAEITGYYGDERDLRVPSEVEGHPIVSIGECAFGWYSGLLSVTLPEGLQSVDEYAFYDCSSLASVTLPEGLQSLGGYAFSGCTSLTGLNIPDSVTSIAELVFAGCTSLSSLYIPEGVESIGYGAFYRYTSLNSLRIPDSVTKISAIAFDDSVKLTLIVGCGSYAKKYADANKIPYTYTDGGK